MKSNFPEDYLIKMCELVYINNKDKVDFNIEPTSFYKNGEFLKII